MTTSLELASGHVIYGSPAAIAAVERIIGLSAERLKALDAANRELAKTQQWIDRENRRYLAMVDTATHFKKLAENRMPPAPFANVPSYEFAPKYVKPASAHFHNIFASTHFHNLLTSFQTARSIARATADTWARITL